MTNKILRLSTGEQDVIRLDKFIAASLPDYSRTRLQSMVREGLVSVDGVQITKPGFVLEGQVEIRVEIPPNRPTELIPEDISLDIIFENDDLMVVNKPAGMVVHPSAGHHAGTLVHAALAHAPGMEGVGGEQRPGVVHRLDKETSGLILLAKNDIAHRWLQDQFKMRVVNKVYVALVDGHPPTPKGRIEAPIGRDPAHRQKMAVTPIDKGREAVTEYFTIKPYKSFTLLEAHPHTGRTHQIRVHMAFLGCPVVGDVIYGYKKSSVKLQRHFLHAKSITIQIPGEDKPRTFKAPLPEDLEDILKKLD